MNIQIFTQGYSNPSLIAIDMKSVSAIQSPCALGFEESCYNDMSFIRSVGKAYLVEYFAIQATLITHAGNSLCACVKMTADEVWSALGIKSRATDIGYLQDNFTDAEAMLIFLKYLAGTLKTPYIDNIEKVREAVGQEAYK